MKKLLALLSLVAAFQRAFALSDYEPFANATANGGTAYTVGSLLFSGTTAIQTNATAGAWFCVSNLNGAPVTGQPVITNGNLSYPGLSASPGNSLLIQNSVGNMGRMTLPFPPVSSGQCYYSFLLQVTDISALSTSSTSNWFIGFGDTTGAQHAALVRAESYIVTKKSGSGYVLGIGKSKPGAANEAYDTTVHNVGEVVFVVANYDYTVTGHPASLWIDPATNTFGAATPPSATVTETTGSDINSPGIQSIMLGCFTVAPAGCLVDELRVGTNWAVVTSAPDIQTQPAALNTNAGTTASFSVYATGGTPLSYQWMNSSGDLSDGGSIVGSSTATLSITNCTANNADSYSVIVSNNYGAVTSSMAGLTVNDPWVNTPPAGQTLPPSSIAVFTVVASGVPTLTYGWVKDGVALTNGGNISGATGPTLIVSNVSYADAGNYYVFVTNGLNASVQSAPAALIITDPAVTAQPQSVTNNYGTTATFQVTASGQTALSYLWQEVGVGALSDGGGVSGSHSNILTLTGVSYTNDGTYYVTVSDLNGSTNSSSATLTVIEPLINSQPASLTNVQGTTATFNVGAVGAGTLVYQWSKNAVPYTSDAGNITGSQSATLSVSGVTASDDGSYSVTVTDASSMSAQSINAVLTVLTPPSIISGPSPLTITPGNRATFAVAASGATPLYYQWYSNSVIVPAATNFAYTLTNVQLGMSGGFSVIVSNSINSVTSSVAPLGVVPSIHLYHTNLVIVRLGDGAQTPSLSGNSIYLDQITTNGAYLNTVCIPDSGPSALIGMGPMENGTTLTGTALSVSGDGLELVVAGYNTPVPYSLPLEASTASAVPRGVALINSSAHYLLPISDTNAYNATYVRGATSDGTNNFWGAGGAAGTYYYGLGSSPVTIQSQSAFVNLRTVNIFNGNLYTVSGSSAGIGVLGWTGLPTTPTPATDFFTPTEPCDLAIDSTGTNMYVSTTAGAAKYQFDGANWNYQYTLSSDSLLYMTVDFSGTYPVIYGTTYDFNYDRLVSVVDINGVASPEVTVATAGVNENIRGVRFGPGEPYFNVSSDPSDIILAWNGRYNLQASTNVAGPYTTIPSATSPYTNAFTNANALFFRLEQ